MLQKTFTSIFNAQQCDNNTNQETINEKPGHVSDNAKRRIVEDEENKRIQMIARPMKMHCLQSKSMNHTSPYRSVGTIQRVVNTSSSNISDNEKLHPFRPKRSSVQQHFVPEKRKSIHVVRRVLNASVWNHIQPEEEEEEMADNIHDPTPKPLCKALMGFGSFHVQSQTMSKNSCKTSNVTIRDASPTRTTADHSELDLLLQLIKSENDTKYTPTPMGELCEHYTSQRIGGHSQITKIRRCLKNGYLEKLQYTLQRLAMDSKYLEQDNNLDLIQGAAVTVVSLDISFNIYMATVRTEVDGSIYRILLEPHIGQQVYAGRSLEVFFEQKPYELNALKLPIFLQPQKVILIEANGARTKRTLSS